MASHDQWQEIAAKDSTLAKRFWSKVQKTETHWLWLGAEKGNNHYGALRIGGKHGPVKAAHQLSYRLHHGAFEGLQVLHTCDIPKCVNPAHLYLGTHKKNMEDKMSRGRYVSGMAKRTHCKLGHILDGLQTFTQGKYVGNKYRFCKTCARLRKKR